MRFMRVSARRSRTHHAAKPANLQYSLIRIVARTARPLHYALPFYSIAMAPAPLELDGSIWLRAGAQTWGGKSRIDLLTQIDATGSTSAAARAVGMSYKGAWDAIAALNNLPGDPRLPRPPSGTGGGGAPEPSRGGRGKRWC